MARRVFYFSWLLAANIITPMGEFAEWNDRVQGTAGDPRCWPQIPIRPATNGNVADCRLVGCGMRRGAIAGSLR